MIRLLNNVTGDPIADLSEEELQFLIDQLEETFVEDTDYWIDGDTIDFLEEAGAEDALLKALREGLAGRDGMEIRWVRA